MGRLSERKRVCHGCFAAEVIWRWIGFGPGIGFGENPSRAAVPFDTEVGISRIAFGFFSKED
jgi:hypothetical protein